MSKIVEVEIYDLEKDLFVEKDHNFIVTPHPTENGVVNVIGKLDSDDKIISLNKEEIVIAKQIGFRIFKNVKMILFYICGKYKT